MDTEGCEDLQAASESLWRMRHLLGRLVFKLAVLRTLLSAEAYQWLPFATDDIAGLVDELDLLDRDLAEMRGLRLLAAAAPEPWDAILSDHYRSLVRLRRDLRRVAAATDAALAAGSDSLMARMEALEADDDELGGEVLRVAWSGAERAASLARLPWEIDDIS